MPRQENEQGRELGREIALIVTPEQLSRLKELFEWVRATCPVTAQEDELDRQIVKAIQLATANQTKSFDR